MNYEIYTDLKIEDDFHVFDFESTGRYGTIRKRVMFESTELPEVYNLVFGDLTDNNEIDDYSRSNNGDRDKILATIIKAVEMYTDHHPQNWIYFRGSTKERTRLYRIVIGLNLEELSQKFEIYAETENGTEFQPFHKNMKINAFLIKRKIS